MSLVVPAVLPTSREDFEERLATLTRIPSVNRIQIDVVDGTFASPASWPYTAPQELRDMVSRGEMLPALDRIDYEIDLMCLDAEGAIDAWLALGASRFTFHAESAIDLARSLEDIRTRYGCGIISCDLMSIGLAVNIESHPSFVEPYLDEIDYIQFMGIARIGRQGQPFDRRVLDRVRLFRSRHPHCAIQIDGGVSLDTARELIESGATNLVVGSALVHAADPAGVIEKFEMLQTPYGV